MLMKSLKILLLSLIVTLVNIEVTYATEEHQEDIKITVNGREFFLVDDEENEDPSDVPSGEAITSFEGLVANENQGQSIGHKRKREQSDSSNLNADQEIDEENTEEGERELSINDAGVAPSQFYESYTTPFKENNFCYNYHSHVACKSECNISAVYINKKTELEYDDGHSNITWSRKIISPEDDLSKLNDDYLKGLTSSAEPHAIRTIHNHLFVRFEIGYREKPDDQLKWAYFPLYWSKDEGLPKVTTLDDSCRLVDFYNHCAKNNSVDETTYLKAPFQDIEAFETAVSEFCDPARKITCTTNGRNHDISSGYHSEGHALACLYSNHTHIFKSLISEVQKLSKDCSIEASIMKFYSSHDICPDCQGVLIHSRPFIENLFKQAILNNLKKEISVPVIFIGTGTLTCSDNYWRTSDNVGQSICKKQNGEDEQPCFRSTPPPSQFFQSRIYISQTNFQKHLFTWFYD